MAGIRGFFRSLREFGPAALVTAAFIGPGTLTTCTLAGASWGFTLLWGLLFATIATIILQDMASRLGIAGRRSLGEAINMSFSSGGRIAAVAVVILAIGIGNAAYEAGNIAGASMGIESVTSVSTIKAGAVSIRIWPLITGVLAFIILFSGSYRMLERILVSLVILMSITFITAAVMIKPPLAAILRGLFVPEIPNGSLVMLIGLIGTTVVPYNLFLHASAAREKWKRRDDISKSTIDSVIAIGLGGVISGAIVVTSASAFYGTGREIAGVADLGVQLEPLLGGVSRYFMAAGIFSAGISSAVTAPLAASYAITGVLNLENNMRSRPFRLIWICVLFTGVLFATLGMRPVRMILLAQFMNGLLLPVLAIFLLKAVNNRQIMGDAVNGPVRNSVGIIIILITFLLGLRSIAGVAGII
ncbi:MAG: divalent metal cation transporter [Bacteroidetes bacterium]|nr:divalent metal cation transporter [Bacteroidota bacterium]